MLYFYPKIQRKRVHFAMKKTMFLIPVLCIALAGCGASSETQSAPSVLSSSTSVLPDTIESSVASELNISDPTPPTTGSLEPQVLYETDQVVIQAEGIESDSDSTYMEITIKNLLDQDILVSCTEAYVNKYLLTSSFSAEIPANDSVLTGIEFSNTDLNACDIHTIGEISFSLSGFDYESADTLYETDVLHITTDQYGSFEQEVNTEGTLLWENSDVSFIHRGYTHDEEFNPVAVILIVNNSEKSIFADAETTGSSADSSFIDFGYMLAPGTRALVYVNAFNSEGSLLDSLDGITYHFMLSDGETWEDIATSEDLTF